MASQLMEVGAGVHAYLQTGSWGYSNAGLIVDAGASLLVDTLYDLKLTESMLTHMRRMVPGAERIGTVVNTHANGDHCWGNQLVSDAEIIASRATAEEMTELPPQAMAALMALVKGLDKANSASGGRLEAVSKMAPERLSALTESAPFWRECFGDFEFGGIRLTPPTRTFSGTLSLSVGDKRVELIELGPAHTRGDTVVFLPDDKLVFTGDLLFSGSHPIIWERPVGNWVRACNALLALDIDTVVPGHGPLTDKAGIELTKAYWQLVEQRAREGHASGASAMDVAQQLLSDGVPDWEGWGEAHRLVVNVDCVYRELNRDEARPDAMALFKAMARLEKRCPGGRPH